MDRLAMLAFIVVPPLASASPRASPACDLGARAFRDPHISFATLTTHGHRVERRRRRQQHARADGFGRGGAATAWAAAALSARARRLCAARARSGAQGSVAARGNAAAVASRRAARARRGGQVIGRRVMGRRVTAPSDRRRAVVARPQLTLKACGARLLVSGGGRHVARREDDKCASYGSLFIGQSSGTQVETEHGRRKAGGAGGR